MGMKDEPGLSPQTAKTDRHAQAETEPHGLAEAEPVSPAMVESPVAEHQRAESTLMPPTDSAGNPRETRRLPRFGSLILRCLVLAFGCSIFITIIYRLVPPPVTPLMLIRLADGAGLHKDWVPYEDISPNLPRAIIAAEDSGFCQHNGFDWTALEKAWQRNQHSSRMRGGSTISNQTAKNVFLWPDRTYIRKAIEFYFTGLIEFFWSKKRILEVYLNVVEWGPGIYGAEAAAHAHFGKPAKALTRREAALLAAVLPNPRRWSASKPTPYIRGRASTIQARMGDIPDPAGAPCKP
jgi:monofunctional biosynthetic peptidoglycan transglycosylase